MKRHSTADCPGVTYDAACPRCREIVGESLAKVPEIAAPSKQNWLEALDSLLTRQEADALCERDRVALIIIQKILEWL